MSVFGVLEAHDIMKMMNCLDDDFSEILDAFVKTVVDQGCNLREVKYPPHTGSIRT